VVKKVQVTKSSQTFLALYEREEAIDPGARNPIASKQEHAEHYWQDAHPTRESLPPFPDGNRARRVGLPSVFRRTNRLI
jgi:hypothetical protein